MTDVGNRVNISAKITHQDFAAERYRFIVGLDIATGLITIIAAVVTYALSQSIWLAGAVLLAAVMVLRSIKPIIANMFESRIKLDHIKVVTESNMDSSKSRGARFLVMTQDIELNPLKPEDREKIDRIVQRGVEELSAESKLFELRYTIVTEKGHPFQLCYTPCGKGISNIRRRHNEWLVAAGVKAFGGGNENKELFLRDLYISADNAGNTDNDIAGGHNALLEVVFDKNLPS